MVKNCFPADLVGICKRDKKTQQQIGEELGISRASVNMRVKGNVVSKGFVEIMEALGYDVEIHYVKREGAE